ncbi:MAG: hypothetical protein KTQ13_08200, partial [Ferruginibacter sp.]|nr:hypothetical protein [Ferruginibacter sp.]
MKNSYTYLFLAAAVLLLAACRSDKGPKLPALKESFSKKDKNPFGASIAYRQVKSLYASNSIRDVRQPFSKTWKEISDSGSLYICITGSLFVNEEEADAMLQYVDAGNDLFISAAYIDDVLQQKINCTTKVNFNQVFGAMAFTQTSTRSLVEPDSAYSYFYYPFNNYFVKIDSGRTRVVGVNDDLMPTSIVYFHGRGKLYLHCDPRAFSNYFLLKDSNFKYMQQSLAFT